MVTLENFFQKLPNDYRKLLRSMKIKELEINAT